MFVKCIAFMSAKGSLLAGSVLEIVPGSLAGQLEATLPARVPLGLGVLLPLLLLTESLPLLPLQEVQPGQLSTGGRDTGFILGSNIICCRKYKIFCTIKVLKMFLMWNTELCCHHIFQQIFLVQQIFFSQLGERYRHPDYYETQEYIRKASIRLQGLTSPATPSSGSSRASSSR